MRSRQRQRRPRGNQPASGLARFPPADRHGDHARERLGDLDPARGPGRRPTAGGPPRSVPHAARPGRPGPAALLRNYSLSGPPRAGYYRLTVKRERCGVVSGYLHTRLAVGDRLDVAAPRGTFILDQTQAPVLLISAGIGATPVLAMLGALAQEHSDREVGGCMAPATAASTHSLPRAGTCCPRCRTSGPACTTAIPARMTSKAATSTTQGDLTPSALTALGPPLDAEAHLCGPAAFMDDISAALAALGIDATHIHTEPFGPARSQTPGIAATPDRAPHPPAGQPGGGPTHLHSPAAT